VRGKTRPLPLPHPARERGGENNGRERKEYQGECKVEEVVSTGAQGTGETPEVKAATDAAAPAADAKAPEGPDAAVQPVTSANGRRASSKPGAALARRAAESVAKPRKYSKAKAVVIVICFLLFLVCLGVGVYIVFFKPGKAAPGHIEKYSPEARSLIEKATRAETLYNEALEKSKSEVLEDLQAAERNMTEALQLWTDIAGLNQTVDDFAETIELAHRKRPSMDIELRALRTRLFDAENAQRREKFRQDAEAKKALEAAAKAAKAAEKAAAAKAAKGDDLSDENINRLIDADPSEAERLIKLRQKKEPGYKPPREP
jgi:hypothetical protein